MGKRVRLMTFLGFGVASTFAGAIGVSLFMDAVERFSWEAIAVVFVVVSIAVFVIDLVTEQQPERAE